MWNDEFGLRKTWMGKGEASMGERTPWAQKKRHAVVHTNEGGGTKEPWRALILFLLFQIFITNQ